MPLDLPTFGDDFLEREATQFLQTHLGPDLPIPVDMELLIERIEGLDLDYWPALRANYGIEGGGGATWTPARCSSPSTNT